MHSVSPVHIRIENHVKNPMISTNFDLNKNKTKKKVKIGPSCYINKTTKKELNTIKKKSNSLLRWCPAPAKSTKMNHKIDLMKTLRLSDYEIKIPTCEVCVDSRSRSKSPFDAKNDYIRDDLSVNLDHSIIGLNFNNNNNSRRATSLSPVSMNRSLDQTDLNGTYTMPFRSKSHESVLKTNDYEYDYKPVRNYFESDPITKKEFLINKLIDSESFLNEILKSLCLLKDFLSIECSNTSNVLYNSPQIIKQFEKDRNSLIQLIDLFQLTNNDLKSILYDLNSLNDLKSFQDNEFLLKQVHNLEIENNNFKKLIFEYEKNLNRTGSTNEALNLENNALAKLKHSLEDNRAHLRRQLIAREADINRLNVQIKNLNRKLDRSQLEIELLRESREKAGLSTLKFPATSTISLNQLPSKTSIKNIKLSKNHFSLEEVLADPIKTRLYIEKLNSKLKEKDLEIKNLTDSNQSNLDKINFNHANNVNNNNNNNNNVLVDEEKNSNTNNTPSWHSKSDRNEKSALERIRKENEKLKVNLKVKEDKLKLAESKLKILQENLEKNKISSSNSSKKNTRSKQSNLNNESSDDATSNLHTQTQTHRSNRSSSPKKHVEQHSDLNQAHKSPDNSSILRDKNFSQVELNNVRSRLQQRLNELEPLPELLKSTELKLHDALAKLKTYESEITENRKIISELKSQLEMTHIKLLNRNKDTKLLSDVQKNTITNTTTNNTTNLIQSEVFNQQQKNFINNNKFESIERRLQSLDEENKELIRQLGQKDELIRDITNKLSIKSNEASSFSRQLDLALSDSNIREHQIKEKFISKERALQSKITELESKIRSVELHSSVDKRDKDEMAHDYLTQIRDLKAKLEQTQLTNKQMQEYVNFLKNSYISYFNDNTLQSFEFGSGMSSSNFLNGNGSNNFF